MSNRDAAEDTVAALRDDGKLGEADEALVELVLSLASSMDEAKENTAAVAREYRMALVALMTGGTGGGDDGTQAFLVAVRAPTVYPSSD